MIKYNLTKQDPTRLVSESSLYLNTNNHLYFFYSEMRLDCYCKDVSVMPGNLHWTEDIPPHIGVQAVNSANQILNKKNRILISVETMDALSSKSRLKYPYSSWAKYPLCRDEVALLVKEDCDFLIFTTTELADKIENLTIYHE